MKFYFSAYGWIQYIDSKSYCSSPTMSYVETYFKEHAEQGYISEVPFKCFGITSIDVVYNEYNQKYYFTFLQ